MPRSLWKGAVSFGLVYIPVELHSASRSSSLDLDLLDKRDFSPVGYQRVNKRTGRVVEWGDIVKGYQYKKGEYVALSEEDFRQANIKASQTIEIESFADAADISPEYYATPYYLVPMKGGEKGYTLLRETLQRVRKVGVGSIVMRGRQHLCAIVAEKRALVLNTLRFAQDLRPADELELPPVNSKAAKVSPREIAMAERLVEEMSASWHPQNFSDTYREDLMRRIQEKVRKRQTHLLTPNEKPRKETRQSAEIIDLMSVLKRSLESRGAVEDDDARSRPSATRRKSGGSQRSRRAASTRTGTRQRA